MAMTAVAVSPEKDTREKAPSLLEVSEEDSDNDVVVKSIHGELKESITLLHVPSKEEGLN
jgi:isochorismate synthase EntC